VVSSFLENATMGGPSGPAAGLGGDPKGCAGDIGAPSRGGGRSQGFGAGAECDGLEPGGCEAAHSPGRGGAGSLEM